MWLARVEGRTATVASRTADPSELVLACQTSAPIKSVSSGFVQLSCTVSKAAVPLRLVASAGGTVSRAVVWLTTAEKADLLPALSIDRTRTLYSVFRRTALNSYRRELVV